MDKQIFVFGHMNPDTDSICSAIAYTNLKKELGYKNVVAARLGDINRETKFVLDYFDVEIPVLLENVEPQVCDLNFYVSELVRKDDSVKTVWELMKNNKRKMFPVVDEKNRLTGVVSITDIATAYMELEDEMALKNQRAKFSKLIEALDGEVIAGSYPYE